MIRREFSIFCPEGVRWLELNPGVGPIRTVLQGNSSAGDARQKRGAR